MNAQHRICRAGNRFRRCLRRIADLKAEMTDEIIRAEEQHRFARTSDLFDQINRLESRARELAGTKN